MAEPDSLDAVKIIECPRDAMQGWGRFIPTATKIRYLNTLLKVGFDSLDFGSFVSPGAVPQMADTARVTEALEWEASPTRLLAIVANERGAEEATSREAIAFLGYPFSVSETFQLRNTRRTIQDSVRLVERIQALCVSRGKRLVIYISMGFGNPYGDPYEPELVLQWVDTLASLGVGVISVADTVGVADTGDVGKLFSVLIPAHPGIEFGAHFHARPDDWQGKVAAAYDHGCRRFDAAISGIGGCPMAGDELVGNLATENILAFLKGRGLPIYVDTAAFGQACRLASGIFQK